MIAPVLVPTAPDGETQERGPMLEAHFSALERAAAERRARIDQLAVARLFTFEKQVQRQHRFDVRVQRQVRETLERAQKRDPYLAAPWLDMLSGRRLIRRTS